MIFRLRPDKRCVVGLLLSLFCFAMPAKAHKDTLAQVITPDPLVKSYEAEALPAVGATQTVSDATATGQRAVLLNAPGSGFNADFGTLPIGMHCAFVCARVDPSEAVVQVKTTRDGKPVNQQETKPLYFELRINSGANGEVELHRLRVPYNEKGQYEYVAKIYFHTPQARAYTGTVTLGERTALKQVWVDRIELRNPLAHLQFRAIKTRRMLYSDEQVAQLRQSALKEGKIKAPIRQAPLSPKERRRLDDIIWKQSVLPINAQPEQAVYPESSYGNDELKKIVAAEKAKRDIGQWTLASGGKYDEPWRLVNTALGGEYSLADYNAGKTLPAPWPFPEDKGTYFFDKNQWSSTSSFNSGIVPVQMRNHFEALLASLGAMPSNEKSYRGNLPDRYVLGDDKEAAADASFLLAALAYNFPSQDWNLHNMANVFKIWRTFDAAHQYGRLDSYQGWSTGQVMALCEAYDKLFPYIQGNTELAARIGRFVPWVKTPEDVVKLFDTFLVQRSAQDAVQHILYAPALPTAAVVLGPGPVSDKYLNQYFSKMYLRDVWAGYGDSMVNAHSRDGLNYIGSSFYTSGESKQELFEVAQLLGQYVRAGGDKKFDISDPKRYPRLAATPDSIIKLMTAGHFRTGVGDVGDPQQRPSPTLTAEDGDLLLAAYQASHDARYAWLLVNRVGQGIIPDKEWETIKASASTTRDPVLHQGSHVLEGYGIATLEEGMENTDPRHKTSTMLRFGVASGHAHSDTLDIELYAHGVRLSGDLGGRPGGQYGHPSTLVSRIHNVVEIDDRDFNDGPINSTATGALTAYSPMPGAQFMQGQGRASNLPQVNLYQRGLLQVLCDEGDGKAQTPASYVFDVFRVDGGKVHTWNFHGAPSEDFRINASLSKAQSPIALKLLEDHWGNSPKQEGRAPDILEASWKLRRKEETVDGIPLKNAEQQMMGDLYDPAAPEKWTRVSLFGNAGQNVMVGNWESRGVRQHNFPFLYVRRESQDSLGSVFPAIIEPYAGEPVITSKKMLRVSGTGSGAQAPVALEIQTRFGQRDLLFGGGVRGKDYSVEDGIAASGDVGFVSRDANGLRLAHLIGGRALSTPEVRIEFTKPEYRTTITGTDYTAQAATLATALPARLLDGAFFSLSNGQRQTTYQAKMVKGNRIQFERTSSIYQGGVELTDQSAGCAQLDLGPSLYDYHRDYYEGATIVNESGQVLGKASIKPGDRFWYLGFPEARRHLQVMRSEDVTDADGDGKTTLTMIATSPQRKPTPDGKGFVTVNSGEKMLDLEFTRVRPDGYMLWTKQHPREYVDSADVPHPGWPYLDQKVVNEKGDKSWIVNMPGDTYQLFAIGKKFTDADFPDADKDGRRLVTLHDYGPGDRLVLPAFAYLRRLPESSASEKRYELRANAMCTLALKGKTIAISVDGGKQWKTMAVTSGAGMVQAKFSEKDLGAGIVQLRVK